jgi:hypothetical protein
VGIAGKGIGYGMAKSELVFDRINTFEKITYRTVERKSGKAFRGSGNVSKIIKMGFQPYLSVPRAASFAFTIRLGGLSQQMKLEGFDNSVEPRFCNRTLLQFSTTSNTSICLIYSPST